MRVLHVVADGDPGWAATAAMAMVDAAQAARGVRHMLVTETGSPLAAAARARGIPTATRAFQRPRGFGTLRPRLVETVWEVAPDVVHAHGLRAGFAVLPALSWLGLPMVLSMPSVGAPRPGPLGRLGQWLERRSAIRGACVLLYGTEAEAQAARAAGIATARRPAFSAPVPLALDTLPERASPMPLVLLQGRIHPDFPAGRVVAALAAAPADTRLAVLGDGAGLARLAAALDGAGLSGRVDWPGPVPRHESLELLARAAAVLDPRDGTGVPLGLVEAACVGVPVVTGARPALAEALAIAGVPHGAGDAAWGAALAAAIGADAGAARRHARERLAAVRAAEPHLRAWTLAADSVTHALAEDAAVALPGAVRGT